MHLRATLHSCESEPTQDTGSVDCRQTMLSSEPAKPKQRCVKWRGHTGLVALLPAGAHARSSWSVLSCFCMCCFGKRSASIHVAAYCTHKPCCCSESGSESESGSGLRVLFRFWFRIQSLLVELLLRFALFASGQPCAHCHLLYPAGPLKDKKLQTGLCATQNQVAGLMILLGLVSFATMLLKSVWVHFLCFFLIVSMMLKLRSVTHSNKRRQLCLLS